VENHLGQIEFDSVLGKGTTFRVHLPAKAKSEVPVG
jgi:signal transduction histidine kinase